MLLLLRRQGKIIKKEREIYDKSKWEWIRNCLNFSKIKYVSFLVGKSIKLQVETPNDYRLVVAKLKEKDISHSSYQLPEDRVHMAVLRGVIETITDQQIMDEFKADGILATQIHRMTKQGA